EADDVVLGENLHPLGHPHREFPAPAHRIEFVLRRAAGGELSREQVCAGDSACAASPMQSRPGRVQRFNRLIATVSSFTSSHVFTSDMPAFRTGAIPMTSARKASSPRAVTASYCPLAIT